MSSVTMSRKRRCSCKNNSDKKHTAGLTRTLCAALSQLCWIFCCPPCPPCIIRKIAFHPPKPPTYRVVLRRGVPEIEMLDDSLKVLTPAQMRGEVVLLHENANTCVCRERRTLVAMQWLNLPLTARSNLIILHSHVNAADLGSVQFPMELLARRIGCDVLAYDYSGYGASEGVPGEDTILRNADMVMKYIIEVLQRPASDVIVYGQSIGSVPTWYLASKYEVAGVIQLSGLYSGWRTLHRDSGSSDQLAQPPMSGCCCLNPFNNAGLVKRVRSPILLVHGKADEVIQFSQALELYSLCGVYAVQPLWLDGIGHVGIERTREFYDRINKFVHEEVRPSGGATVAYSTTISSASTVTPAHLEQPVKRSSQFPPPQDVVTNSKSRISGGRLSSSKSDE